jgi:hypothetical protein
MLSEPIVVLTRIARAFDSLGIPYVVGGSIASSAYGKPRATLDVDVVAEIPASKIDPLLEALNAEFAVDRTMVREAVQQRSSFNIIYLPTMFKADVFIAGHDEWSHQELIRGRSVEFDTPDGKVNVRFATPEDTLLHKLVWYRLGNEVSDRQWGDIVGIVAVQKDSLDRAYLHRWAEPLGVAGLLARALQG